jgi:cytochrome P450
VMNKSDQTMPEKISFGSLFSGELTGIFPLYAQMRSKGAIVPLSFPQLGTNNQAWVVTRMEEAVQILKDHAHFTVDPRSIGIKDLVGLSGADTDKASNTPSFFKDSMLSVDEPDHRRLRSLVSKGFTPRYIESLRPRVQQLADELLDRVQDQGQMDIVADYAYPLPINVISEMLGVPQADRAQIRVWSEALGHGLGQGRRDEGIMAAMRAFGEYTAQLVAEKRLHPADDLVSQLTAIEEEGDRLSEAELISMITLLIFAGHETTSNLIGTGTTGKTQSGPEPGTCGG